MDFWRQALLGGAAVGVVMMAQPAQAQTKSFDVPAQPAATGIAALARQADVQILISASDARGRTVNAVRGDYSVAEAIGKLLEGTGLQARSTGAQTWVVVATPAGNGQGDAPVAQVDEIVVTGTRIRGGDTPASVIRIDAEQMKEEGFADLGEVVRSLSQNFSGGQNPGISAGATDGGRANQNITGGSGLNLRGLGQDASLTLLNGRRMAYGGFVQMVDISAIPTEAVERMEILADGASALYGSDAVGGVANVILKRDFEGVTVATRHGVATDGGLETHEYSATAGATWSSGGVIATVKSVSNDPVYSDQRAYAEDMFAPSTLYQKGELQSGLLSAHQALGGAGEVRLDVMRSRRQILTDMAYATNYERNEPETNTVFVSPSVDVVLPHGWLLSAGGAWGKDDTDVDYSIVTLATGASTLSRPYYRNESLTYDLGAEGPLFALGGGEARLAVGAGYRKNTYRSGSLISGAVTVDGNVGSRFAYAELNLPFIGPDQNTPGVYRLTATGAVRTEDYDGYGDVSTPKLGLIYSPTADFTLKASWGRSFKVPTLSQQFSIQNAILFPAAVIGGSGYAADATALYYVGGNPELKPERARTWSGSFAVHPRRLPGFEAELTWFDIDYTNRVVQPLVPAQSLSNPSFAPFIQYDPTAAQLAEILASSTFVNGAGVAYDPSKVVAIASNLFINTASERARGLDLSGSYRLDLGEGRLTVRGSASWLDMTRQISSAETAYDLTGTLFYPAKFSARFGGVWSQDGFTAAFFGNHRSGVTNTSDGVKGASFTTFDATLRYDTGDRSDVLAHLTFELSAENLFDKAPPLYDAASRTSTPYDSTNYSAIGRFISFSIAKRF